MQYCHSHSVMFVDTWSLLTFAPSPHRVAFGSIVVITVVMVRPVQSKNEMQVSHVSTECDYPLGAGAKDMIEDSWAVSQVCWKISRTARNKNIFFVSLHVGETNVTDSRGQSTHVQVTNIKSALRVGQKVFLGLPLFFRHWTTNYCNCHCNHFKGWKKYRDTRDEAV